MFNRAARRSRRRAQGRGHVDEPGAPVPAVEVEDRGPSSASLPPIELTDRVQSRLLVDQQLESEVQRIGYVVVGRVLDQDTLDALREVHRRFDPLISSRRSDRWFTSGAVEDAEVRGSIYAEVGDLVRTAIAPLALDGTAVLGSHFHVNPAGSADGIAPHQDIPLVDEATASTLNGWIPLWDVTGSDAPLCVVPGSHRFGLVDRSLQMDWRYDGSDGLFREYAVPIAVPAGHLILFDGAAVHCSGPNRGERDRVAVNFHLAPDGEHIYHVAPVEDAPTMVDEYLIEIDVFHDLGPAAVGVADAARRLGRRPIRPGSTDPTELRALCERGAGL